MFKQIEKGKKKKKNRGEKEYEKAVKFIIGCFHPNLQCFAIHTIILIWFLVYDSLEETKKYVILIYDIFSYAIGLFCTLNFF